MKYTYIKAQFRTRYVFVCQISAAHVVIVLNTLLQKCVDDEHYLWISSQVQAQHPSLLRTFGFSAQVFFEHPNKWLVCLILSKLSNQAWKKVQIVAY